jgi:hypothetical protein
VDLVPGPLWGVNLRSNTEGLGTYRWRKLRKHAIQECGGKCVICGSDQRLHGHEVWKYEEKKTVGRATLVRVDVICWTCHNITHWGNTARLIAFGAISNEGHMTLRRHFRRVNRCKQIDFDRHARRELSIWKRRSQLRWRVDWGPHAQAVADAKQSRATWRECRSKSRLEVSASNGCQLSTTTAL